MNTVRALEVVGFNLLLLLGIYLVSGDITTRSAYAAREGLSYVFSQSFLVEMSTLQGRGENLASPLTLAWLQVIVVVLIVVDALYVYDWAVHRRVAPAVAA